MSKVDYLTEDTILPDGQNFVCISFLTDKENKTTLSGIKVRGGFSTYEEACGHAKKVQTVDPYFNVFVGEMGKWLPFDPNPDSHSVKDSEYANEQLNNMMKSYMENQEKAKLYHEQRKNELVRQNILENLATRQDNLKDAKKRLNKAQNEEDKKTLESSVLEIEEQISKMELKKQELDDQIESLSSQVKQATNSRIAPPKIIEN
jgi:molecular chaperone DnaK (HSP70)